MRRILLFLLLLCAPVSANAAENEIKIGFTTATRYNDNIGNVSDGKKTDSFSFDFGPTIQFDSSAATYELGGDYSPRVSIFVNNERDEEVSHNFAIRGEYRPTERWTLRLRDRLSLETDADRDTDDGSQGDLDDSGSRETLRNSVNGNVRYGVTPRMSLSSNAGHSFVDREDKSLSDSMQFSGGVQGNYVVGARDTFGIGASARHQALTSENPDIEDTTTDYFGFFFSWDHRFTPLMGASASGGPTWVISKREGGDPKKTITDYFANARIFAEFGNGSTSISYQRTSSDFARTSTAYLIDIVNVNADWAASRRLVFGVSGGWSQRTAVRSFSGTSFEFEERVSTWRAAASVSYQLRRELRSSFTLDFLRQDEQGEDPSDRFRATIRLNYNARTFRF